MDSTTKNVKLKLKLIFFLEIFDIFTKKVTVWKMNFKVGTKFNFKYQLWRAISASKYSKL